MIVALDTDNATLAQPIEIPGIEKSPGIEVQVRRQACRLLPDEVAAPLDWRERMALTAWPVVEVVGRHDLGLALGLDGKAAHAVAEALAARGHVTIKTIEKDERTPAAFLDAHLYRLSTPDTSDKQYLYGVDHSRESLECPIYGEIENTLRITFVPRVRSWPSAYRTDEDRFQRSGSLGRGVLHLVWQVEGREALGEPVSVATLVKWSGAQERVVRRWLGLMRASGGATVTGSTTARRWTITLSPSLDLSTYKKLYEGSIDFDAARDILTLLGMHDARLDEGWVVERRTMMYGLQLPRAEEWTPPPATEVRSCCPFRHYEGPQENRAEVPKGIGRPQLDYLGRPTMRDFH